MSGAFERFRRALLRSLRPRVPLRVHPAVVRDGQELVPRLPAAVQEEPAEEGLLHGGPGPELLPGRPGQVAIQGGVATVPVEVRFSELISVVSGYTYIL